jgi:peptidoglycan/xylan/chitin deacetylase (PgdA/CDA1 family)
MNNILLSFDLEEFDIPEEFGQKLNEEEKIRITLSGLISLLELINKHNIKATFYVTAFFAEKNTGLIKRLSEKHEIASHGYFHSSFQVADFANSKQVLDKITGTSIEGYRMARLMPFDKSLLLSAGYSYDSSLNPTWIPGRYNNINKPKTPFIEDKLVVLPASVFGVFRIPLFWLSFKNLPYFFYRSLAIRTLKKDKYLNIYFHPWEFTDISGYKLPFYVKRNSGLRQLIKFEKLLILLKRYGEFCTSNEYKNYFLKGGTN